MDTRIPRGIWLLCGPTGCGKSYLLAKCLTDIKHNIKDDVGEIVIAHNPVVKDANMFNQIKSSNKNISVQSYAGFPEKELASNELFKTKEKMRILVCDDIYDIMCKHHQLSVIQLCTVWSHHMNILVVITTQSLTTMQSHIHMMNTILRNSTVITVFADPRFDILKIIEIYQSKKINNFRALGIIRTIARSFFSKDSDRLIDPYRKLITLDDKHAFLCLDFSQPY